MYNDKNHTGNNDGDSVGFGNNVKNISDARRNGFAGFHLDSGDHYLDAH